MRCHELLTLQSLLNAPQRHYPPPVSSASLNVPSGQFILITRDENRRCRCVLSFYFYCGEAPPGPIASRISPINPITPRPRDSQRRCVGSGERGRSRNNDRVRVFGRPRRVDRPCFGFMPDEVVRAFCRREFFSGRLRRKRPRRNGESGVYSVARNEFVAVSEGLADESSPIKHILLFGAVLRQTCCFLFVFLLRGPLLAVPPKVTKSFNS